MDASSQLEAVFEDSYCKAAAAIVGHRREQRYRTVLLASATRGEGTTTAVLNIAKAIQKHFDLNVLVMEMNYERPAFAELLDVDPARSIEAVISGKAELHECIQKVKMGFAVVPSGGTPWMSNRNGALWQTRFKDVLEQAGEYDLVLVDTPPILEQPEAIVLGCLVRHFVLVVEAGRTSYEVLERVRSELGNQSIMIVGTILNKHKHVIPGWIYRLLAR